MTDIPKPLPCPFCGGEAETDTMQAFRALSTGRLENAAAVYCHACTNQMTVCYSDVSDIPRDTVMADLIIAWNRRTPDIAAALNLIERLDSIDSTVASAQRLIDLHVGSPPQPHVPAPPHFDAGALL